MISLDPYLINHKGIPGITQTVADEVNNHGHDSFFFSWGEQRRSCHFGVIESGFLFDGLHYDTCGLYQYSSLSFGNCLDAITDYQPYVSAKELSSLAPHPSKFRQPAKHVEWDGVVLALQNPNDRSINCVSSPDDYYSFVERAARHYRNRLFLKLHPWNSGEVEARFRQIADDNDCCIDKVGVSVLDRCQFCLIYNSTFAFDCFLRQIPVVQCVPGYFWQTPAVTYSGFSFPDRRPATWQDTTRFGAKLANWVVWRYMIHCQMTPADWITFFKAMYDTRGEVYPVTERFSWAAWLLRSKGLPVPD